MEQSLKWPDFFPACLTRPAVPGQGAPGKACQAKARQSKARGTKGVPTLRTMAGMRDSGRQTTDSTIPPRDVEPQATIVALRSRRFLIVRGDCPNRVRSKERLCKPVSEFRSGERVYYQGREEIVRAVARY